MIKRILLSVTALYLLLVLLPLPSLLCRDKDQNGQNPSLLPGQKAPTLFPAGQAEGKHGCFSSL